ncbi:MAG TPA: type IV secretion system protein VirB10 [Steroidobacteraceae bacterium]
MNDKENLRAGGVTGEAVRGERTTAIVHGVRSAHARVSSLLAAGLMITLGLATLGWYYAHALTRVTRARQQAQSAATSRAQGEMPLPSLGRIEPPSAVVTAAAAAPADRPLQPAPAGVPADPMAVPGESAGASPKVAAQSVEARPARALARRLSGAVLARESEADAHAAVTQSSPTSATPGFAAGAAARDGGSGLTRVGDRSAVSLATLLQAEVTPAAHAALLPTQRWLLPQGSFIDCTLETAIDSTLPGMTTCVTAADTFGADGKVVLLERGTKLVGETRGEVRQGRSRVFVLWTQARTPTGVVVPLASPGTDELGRAGLPGEVDRHFWQRFGAAMLITFIDGAVQAGVQASARTGGTVIYAPSASQDVLTEILKDTAAIPPTVIKHNGDRIEVLVARDLDFRPVYELRALPP